MANESPLNVRPGRFAFAMAAIPTVDCVLNQLNTAFGLSASGVSPLQIVRGGLLLLFFVLAGVVVVRNPNRMKSIPLAIPAGLFLIAGVISKELCETGTISMAGVVPYGQMLYWLMLWATVVLLCSAPSEAELILKGIATGSVMTAISVFLGLAVGTGNFYSGDAVRASAGWFETAKMITGVLTTGGVVLLFLGQRDQRWIFPILACLDFLACILTYARAGTVALSFAFIWLLVWVCGWGRQSRRSATQLAILCALICVIGAMTVSPAQLFARWNDVENGESAGSGRATFWKIAVDEFSQDEKIDQVAGRGYFSMSTMLYEKYGDDIKHTHNDALDMLLVGGVIGCAWLFIFVAGVIVRILHCPIWSPSRAAGIAIVLIYLCHGQLTGQIWGTDAMTYYTMSLSSLWVLRDFSAVGNKAGQEYSSLYLGSLRHSNRLA